MQTCDFLNGQAEKKLNILILEFTKITSIKYMEFISIF